MNKPATLFIIPTPIGEHHPEIVLPQETLSVLPEIKHFLVENLRTARRFLKSAGYPYDFNEVWFYELNEHNQFHIHSEWIQPLVNGNSMGLLSEAGLPCVADPGYTVVRMAHEKQCTVIPLGGPSSILKALMASGLNGQQFTFHGYLPVKSEELKKTIKIIEEQSRSGYSQIFIETPYRNNRMFEALCNICRNETLICIASSLDSQEQQIVTKPVALWKKTKPELKGKPCVFILGL